MSQVPYSIIIGNINISGACCGFDVVNMVLINRDLPKRLPLLILKDKVLLPGSSIRIAVRDNAR